MTPMTVMPTATVSIPPKMKGNGSPGEPASRAKPGPDDRDERQSLGFCAVAARVVVGLDGGRIRQGRKHLQEISGHGDSHPRNETHRPGQSPEPRDRAPLSPTGQVRVSSSTPGGQPPVEFRGCRTPWDNTGGGSGEWCTGFDRGRSCSSFSLAPPAVVRPADDRTRAVPAVPAVQRGPGFQPVLAVPVRPGEPPGERRPAS